MLNILPILVSLSVLRTGADAAYAESDIYTAKQQTAAITSILRRGSTPDRSVVDSLENAQEYDSIRTRETTQQ